jgi:hypothetical protein
MMTKLKHVTKVRKGAEDIKALDLPGEVAAAVEVRQDVVEDNLVLNGHQNCQIPDAIITEEEILLEQLLRLFSKMTTFVLLQCHLLRIVEAVTGMNQKHREDIIILHHRPLRVTTGVLKDKMYQ